MLENNNPKKGRKMLTEKDNKRVFKVKDINDAQEKAILNFIKAAIRTYCGKMPKKTETWFSAWSFLSDLNNDWSDTPLQCLYTKWIDKGKPEDKARKQAGIDAGWLLKRVIVDDEKRMFTSQKGARVREYRFLGPVV